MTEEHPLVERYLSRLQDGLTLMPAADRDEVVRDIRSHIAEATAAGTSLESVLTTLGPAEALARAYAVELVLNPAPGRPPMSGVQRFFALAGILALTSIPTLVIVVTLGAVGISFVVSGFAVFAAGIIDLLGISLPFIDDPVSDVHPAFAVAVGPVLMVAGAAALMGLSKYLRWLARTITGTGVNLWKTRGT
jgi:uncharacterized membrane protein